MENLNINHPEPTVLNCLIVDDEPLAIDGLVYYIGKVDFLKVSQTCFSAIEAREILRTSKIDLMFLDINLPHLSGIDFLEELDNPPLTILTTAYSEYALEGYRLNVIDYLLKPIRFQRFNQAVLKAKDSFESRLLLQQNNDSQQSDMFVKQGNKYTRVLKQDILYVEGMQNYVKIHCVDKVIVVHQTMTALEQMLPVVSFFRIHRSFIVNTSCISAVFGNKVDVRGNELPLSPARKEELLRRLIDKNLLSK